MKVYWRIFLVSILFLSCSKKDKRPDVLSEKKMREVMWDMIRADQYVADFVLKDSTLKKKEESIRLYEQVFRIHKISRTQFKKSLDYYSSRPDLFRPIIDSLAQRRNEIITPHAPANRMNDSLAKPFIRKNVKKQ